MNKKNKMTFLWITVLFMIIILAAQYKFNFDINKEPPSQKWAKGKKITTAKIKSNPKLQKNEKGYLMLINDENKLKIMQLDNMGNVKETKEFPIKEKIINNLSFIKKNNERYLISWDFKNLKGNMENYIEIDNNLNKIKDGSVLGVNESSQIGNEIFLRSYDKKIEVVDLNRNIVKSINVDGANFIRGVEIEKDKYLLMAITEDGYIKSCYYKNGEIKDLKTLMSINLPTGQVILNTSLGFDGKYSYFIMYKKTKFGFETERYTFELNNLEKYSRNKVSLMGIDEVKNVSFISKENGKAKFLAEVTRNFAIKKHYDDIMEIYLKDNEISAGSFLSKSRNSATYGTVNGDVAVYCDYIPNIESYDVYFTSNNQEFKNQNNNVKSFEKQIAFEDTLQGFVYAFVYVLVLGLKWILPSVMIIGIAGFWEYSFSEKVKKILFISVSILTFIFKFQAIYSTNYIMFAHYLPKALSSVSLGFFICLILSFICYMFGYLNYKKDLDVMPIVKFVPYLLVDSVLTLMIFAPYML